MCLVSPLMHPVWGACNRVDHPRLIVVQVAVSHQLHKWQSPTQVIASNAVECFMNSTPQTIARGSWCNLEHALSRFR